MLYLSQLIGRPVRDQGGDPIGTVADLIVAVGERYPPVTGLVVATARRQIFLPWTSVESIDVAGARLRTSTLDLAKFSQRPNEILLELDLMDKQIVDIDGRRVVRVNDLSLDVVEGSLRLVAVDVGASGLLRRLGLEGPMRRLARRLACPPRALHRLGGRRPGRELDRVGQAARAARRPGRAAPGRPGRNHRPARRRRTAPACSPRSTTRRSPTPSRRWSPRRRSRCSRTSTPSAPPTSSRR